MGIPPEPEPVFRTKSGKILTDEDIQALADEAERGYDISNMLTVEGLIKRISRFFPVEIHYEPRNEGQEWRVSLVDDTRDMPVHEHFGDLREGLLWLSVNGLQLANVRERS
jgi:hypothetical protein